MEKLRIGCVVMAAGNASRFGRNKLAAEVDGKTLLRRALEAVPPGRFCRVAVVTQYPETAEAARQEAEGILSDAQAREQAIRHFFGRAMREAREEQQGGRQ